MYLGKCCVLASVGLLVALASPTIAGKEKEPPLQLRIEIDGKTWSAQEGEPLVIPGTLTDPKIRISVEPYRKFSAAGLSFSYPASFAFEDDLEGESFKQWSLDGSNVVIMVQAYATDVALNDFVESVVEEFGKDNCTTSAHEDDLVADSRTMIRLRLRVLGQVLAYDIHRVESRNGTRFLVIQDVLGDAGKPSEEAGRVRAMIKKTLVVN